MGQISQLDTNPFTLPKVRSGQKIRAAHFNTLSDSLGDLMRDRKPAQMRRYTRDAVTIMVAIVKEPKGRQIIEQPDGQPPIEVPGNTALVCKRIRHLDDPPKPGRYSFSGPEFVAYAQPPLNPVDYAPFTTDVSKGVGNAQTLFAHLVDDRRIVELPKSGAAKWCVIRAVGGDLDTFVTAQLVKRTATDPWDGLFEPRGDAIQVAVAPHTYARDYAALVWPGAVIRKTSIVKMEQIDGVWHVSQTLKWNLRRVLSSIVFGDCKTVIE